MLRKTWSCFLLFAALASGCLWAQNSGSVSGKVNDRNSAAVLRATVALTSVDQGTVRSTETNDRGEYLFNNVPPGMYELKVSAPTFESYLAQGLQVEANQSLRADAALVPGSVNDEVVVESSGSTIDTRSATIGMLIEKTLVVELPLDAGNTVGLAALLPGVSDVNAPATFTGERGGPTYNSSGSRNTQNLFLLDGALWNNLYYNTGLNYPPRQGLQEVSVLLNNYKAQYGRNVGSIFNVITKSGTNGVHGQVWEYAQNTMFNAADYFTKKNPKLISNQFGFTVGGPVMRDRLFYELTYQDLRIAGTNVGNLQSLTADEWGLMADGKTERPCSSSGPFAGQTCASFAKDATSTHTADNTLSNPLYDTGKGYVPIVTNQLQTAWEVAGGTGTSPCITMLQNQLALNPGSAGRYLKGAELPSVCFSPVTKSLFSHGYIPIADTVRPGGTYAVTTAKLPRNDQNAMLRLDYVLGRHTIDARYYMMNADDHSAPGVNASTGLGNANYVITYNTGKNKLGDIGDTWMITPNLMNVARAAYKRYVNVISPTDLTTLADMGADLTLPGVPVLPYFAIGGRFTLGNRGQGYSSKVNGSIELDDTLTWTHGRHNVSAGVTWLRLEYLNRTQSASELAFSTTYSGVNAADFLMGLPEAEQFSNQLNQAGVQHDLYLFAQDDWRVLPKLTLNLGLRYELPFQWFQPKGQNQTFIPGYQSQVFPQAPGGLAFVGDKGVLRSLVPTDNNGVAPRVGFAYDVFGNGRTAVRGGFGVFFDAVNANVVSAGQPYYFNFNFATPMGGTSQPLQGLPAIPAGYDPANPQFISPYSVSFPDRNFRTPYVMATNLGIQQQFGHRTAIEVNYVLKLGRKETVPVDLNPAIYDCSGAFFASDPATYCTGALATAASYAARARYPGFNVSGSSIVDLTSAGTSNYNGLQVMFRQKAGRDLTMLGSYTYARSLDIDTNGQNGNNAIPNVDNINSEYGPSDYNVKHNLSMGWTYHLPGVKGSSRAVRAALNGWTFSGIYSIRTGLPINVESNGDPALTNEPNQRPNLVPGQHPSLPSGRHRADKIAEWFNVDAFSIPAKGMLGNVSRNSLVGPAFIRTDMTVGKIVRLQSWRDGMRLNLRLDAFNIFNTPNLAQPNAIIGGGMVGVIGGTRGSNTVAGPIGRRLQLSGTIYF